MDRDSLPATATQADSGGNKGRNIGRRAFVYGVGGAAAGAGALSLEVGPVQDTEAIAPLVLAGGAGVLAAGAAAGYVVSKIDNPFTGDSNEDYQGLADDAFKSQLRQNALNLEQADTPVLGNFENLLDSAPNHVIAQAKKAAIDDLNAGGTATTAKDAATAEVDSFFTTQQNNLVTHLEAQTDKLVSWASETTNYSNVAIGDVLEFEYSTDTWNPVNNIVSASYSNTLVDGSSVSISGAEVQQDGSGVAVKTTFEATYRKPVRVAAMDGDPSKVVFDFSDYAAVWDKIASEHSTISTEISTWVDGVAPSYAAGDIDTSDMISANDLIGDSQTQDGYSFAGASLASMGLKTDDYALEIELVESEETVKGSIYHDDASIDSLQKDTQYDPSSDIAGTVYLNYLNTETGKGELIGLEEPFIIRSVRDSEGNEYSAANYGTSNQQDYSQDIDETRKQLENIREIRTELEEKRDAVGNEPTGGGGFLDGFGGSSNLGILAAGGAVLVYLLGNNNNN